MNAVVSIVSNEIELPRYDRMCHAIAICHRIDEAKKIRDKAEALRAYARQAQNRDAEVQLAEIKVRAERRCGELLRDMAEAGERAPVRGKASDKPRLVDLGLHRSESSRYQMIAAVPEKRFEAHLAERKAAGRPVTSMGLRAISRPPKDCVNEFLEVLKAIERISECNLHAGQWLRRCPAELAERTALAINCAKPWLIELCNTPTVTAQ